jgi:hypothetical protein
MTTHNNTKSNQQIFVEPNIKKFHIENFGRMTRSSTQSFSKLQDSPKPSVGSANSKPSVGSSNSKPSVGSANSKPSVGSANSKPSVGSTNPKSSIGSTNPKSSIGSTNPKSSVGSTKPKSSVGSTKPRPSIEERQKSISNPIFKDKMIKISDMERTHNDLNKIKQILSIEKTFGSKSDDIINSQNRLLSDVINNYSDLNARLLRSIKNLDSNIKKEKCCSKRELDNIKTQVELMQVNIFINLMQLKNNYKTLLDVQKSKHMEKQKMLLRENTKLSYVLEKLKQI